MLEIKKLRLAINFLVSFESTGSGQTASRINLSPASQFADRNSDCDAISSASCDLTQLIPTQSHPTSSSVS